MIYIVIFFVLYFTICVYLMARKRMDIKNGKLCPDWKGSISKHFRWSTFSMEWGRVCYCTNCCGDTTDSWWEWENK